MEMASWKDLQDMDLVREVVGKGVGVCEATLVTEKVLYLSGLPTDAWIFLAMEICTS